MNNQLNRCANILAVLLCVSMTVGHLAAQAADPGAQLASPTVGDVIGRMQDHLGVPWENEGDQTVHQDQFDTPVTGVTVTLFPTYAVLKKASERGHNLIVCHEPVFYTGAANREDGQTDPMLEEKRRLINDHGLVIFRFHDNIHRMKQDGIHAGVIKQLQWEPNRVGGSDEMFAFESFRLADFAKRLAEQIGSRSVRVVGNPEAHFHRVGLSAGAWRSSQHIGLLRRDDVEVLVIGESREWQTYEYVRDLIDAGESKALIVLGHNASEEAGMRWCTDWMRSFVDEVPVEFVPSRQPYWNPLSPPRNVSSSSD